MYNNLQIPKAELHSECCGKGFIVNDIKSIWNSNEYGLLLAACKIKEHMDQNYSDILAVRS